MKIKPTPKPAIKPPLGIIPEYLWNEQRLWLLLETISRYRRAGRPIPDFWLEEASRRIIQFLTHENQDSPRQTR